MINEICRNCETKISNDFGVELQFCTNCGAQIKSTVTNSPQNVLSVKRPPLRLYVISFFGIGFLLLLAGFGWHFTQGNVLSSFTKQYRCSIPGEPEPQTSDEYVARARTHVERNNGSGPSKFDDCVISALDDAVRLDPQNPHAYRWRGGARYERQEINEAIADLDRSIQLDPKEPDAYFLRGLTYSGIEKWERGLADLTSAIELAPRGDIRLVRFYAVRGNINSNKGDDEEAVLDYTEAIKLDPDPENIMYYMDRERAYRRLGKTDLADADDRKINEITYVAKRERDGSGTDISSELVSGGVLNGKAKSMPKPPFPAAARAVRASGTVTVQVLIDESGDVVSASALSGHPLLRAAAVEAAKKAKFAPTLLKGSGRTKVSGVLTYDFVLD